jgi:uncharacterized protein YaaN involved in tellurite resistance
MAEISLKDLQAGSASQMQVAKPDEIARNAAKELQEKAENLTPEEKAQVLAIKDSFNILDSTQTVSYGVGAQRNLSEFSDTILTQIRNRDTGEVGELLTDLLVQVKDMEIEDLGEGKGFFSQLPGIKSIRKRIERFKSKYESVEVQIDRIEGQLENTRVQMLKDIAMYDKLYQKNLEYFNQLNLYIIAGAEIIEEMRNQTLPKLRAEAEQSGDSMNAQLVSDFEDTVNRFEKKVHDLKLSKQMSIQTAPQIRLIQNNDKMLVDKMQTAILNTIPLWKSQIVIALGLTRQEQALKLQKSVTDTTNELLKKNSAKLKQNTIEVAKESERGIVEIETLKQVNRDLIETINETIKIQKEGRAQRQRAEEELVALEEEVKQTLIQARG